MKLSVSKVLRFTAAYDLAATSFFAIPGLAAYYVLFWKDIHVRFAVPGAFPDLQGFHFLFVNMFGISVAIWALIRIIRPEPFQCLIDAIGRVMYSFSLGYYFFFTDVTRITLVFLVPELVLLVLLILAYKSRATVPV